MNAPPADPTVPNSPVSLTEAAAKRIAELSERENNSPFKLRLYIRGGGCSGFQYGFALEEVSTPEDTCVENAGATVLIDPISLQYLRGAQIDYRETLTEAAFVIRNPAAQSTCGCGSSFSA